MYFVMFVNRRDLKEQKRLYNEMFEAKADIESAFWAMEKREKENEDKLRRLKHSLSVVEAEHKTAQTVILTKKKELESLRTELESLRIELSDKAKYCDEICDDNHKLERKLKEMNERYNDNTAELNAARARLTEITGSRQMDFPDLGTISKAFNDIKRQHMRGIRGAMKKFVRAKRDEDAALLKMVNGCELTVKKAVSYVTWLAMHCAYELVKGKMDAKIESLRSVFMMDDLDEARAQFMFSFQRRYEKLMIGERDDDLLALKRMVMSELAGYAHIERGVFERLLADEQFSGAMDTVYGECYRASWQLVLCKDPQLTLYPAKEHFDAWQMPAQYAAFTATDLPDTFKKAHGSQSDAPLHYFVWPALFDTLSDKQIDVTPVYALFRHPADFNYHI